MDRFLPEERPTPSQVVAVWSAILVGCLGSWFTLIEYALHHSAR